MKYMLLIYADEQVWTEPERQACYGESTKLCHQLNSVGKFISASPLQPVSTATSVRVREGKRLVTDGPFAETREYVKRVLRFYDHYRNEGLRLAGSVNQ